MVPWIRVCLMTHCAVVTSDEATCCWDRGEAGSRHTQQNFQTLHTSGRCWNIDRLHLASLPRTRVGAVLLGSIVYPDYFFLSVKDDGLFMPWEEREWGEGWGDEGRKVNFYRRHTLSRHCVSTLVRHHVGRLASKYPSSRW